MKNRFIRSYSGSSLYLMGILNGFTNEDLLLSTGLSNTIGWIFGHLIYYRGMILREFKKECELKEYEDNFKRGAVKNKNLEYTFEEMKADFIQRGENIVTALNKMDENDFAKEMDIQMRGETLNMERYLSMLAFHESFHIGQIDLIKVAVGRGGVQ